MNYRVFLLCVAGLFLSACGGDEAATDAGASAPAASAPTASAPVAKLQTSKSKAVFKDPAYGGDIVAGEHGEIIAVPEEEGSEQPRVGGVPQLQ